MAAMACAVLVRTQLSHGYAAGDQSGATYFSAYARAVLGPLPSRSIFLINNDQMVRNFVLKCERAVQLWCWGVDRRAERNRLRNSKEDCHLQTV